MGYRHCIVIITLLQSFANPFSLKPRCPAENILKCKEQQQHIWRRSIILPSSADEDSASSVPPPPPPPPPPKAPAPTSFIEAENIGLELFGTGDYQGALDMFSLSLNLKGSGWDLGRARTASSLHPTGGAPNPGGGLVRTEFASKEEVQCAKYNMACCYVKLGNRAAALDLIDTVLASGFDEFDTIRRDSTLSTLGTDLESLIESYKPKGPIEKVMRFFK